MMSIDIDGMILNDISKMREAAQNDLNNWFEIECERLDTFFNLLEKVDDSRQIKIFGDTYELTAIDILGLHLYGVREGEESFEHELVHLYRQYDQ